MLTDNQKRRATKPAPDKIKRFAELCGVNMQRRGGKNWQLPEGEPDWIYAKPYHPDTDLNQAVAGLEAFLRKHGIYTIMDFEPKLHTRWGVRVRDDSCKTIGAGFTDSLAAAIVEAVIEAGKEAKP